MNIIRFAGRALLASYFVTSGAKSVLNANDYVDQAQPVTDRLSPTMHKVAPNAVSGLIPTETKTWVKVMGAGQLVAGLTYTMGIFPRVSALVLAKSMIPQIMMASEKSAEGAAVRGGVRARDIALLGATIVATQDTAGRPSRTWKMQERARLQEAIRKNPSAARQAVDGNE